MNLSGNNNAMPKYIKSKKIEAKSAMLGKEIFNNKSSIWIIK